MTKTLPWRKAYRRLRAMNARLAMTPAELYRHLAKKEGLNKNGSCLSKLLRVSHVNESASHSQQAFVNHWSHWRQQSKRQKASGLKTKRTPSS